MQKKLTSPHSFLKKEGVIKHHKRMQKLHDRLMEREGAYAKWHQYPLHQHAQWLFLIAVAVIVGASLINRMQDPYSESYGLESLAAGNGESRGNSPNPDLQALNNQFLQMANAYAQSPAAEKPQQLENLIRLAKQRKDKIFELMDRRQGSLALDLFPEALRAQLPAEVLEFIEAEVSVRGNLSVLFVDGINEADSYIDYELTDDSGKHYKVYFESGAEKGLTGGSVVSFKGKALDDRLYMSDGGSNSIKVLSEPAADVAGNKTLLAILVDFTDTDPVRTQETIYNQLFVDSDSTSALIAEGSYGTVNFTGAATPWLTIDATAGPSCNTGSWYNNKWNNTTSWGPKADQAAQAAGYNLSSYDYRMYFFANVPISVCNFGGRAYLNDKISFINDAYAAHGTKAHELGHNFGAYHAGYYTCGNQQIGPENTCVSFGEIDDKDQYGEQSAKMGSANNYQFHGLHRYQFGWIPTGLLQTVSANGTYTIKSVYSTDPSSPRILKIAKQDTGQAYYISFRQAIGFDASLSSGTTKGASVHLWPASSFNDHTRLLAMTPGQPYTDASLWDGGSFADPANGITVTQNSHTADTATVSATFVCVRANPTVTLSPNSATGNAGLQRNYTMTVKNKDTFACDSSSFNLSQVVPAGWGSSLSSNTMSLAPGTTGTATLSVTPLTSAPDGNYTISANATNATEPAYTGSKNAAYVVFTLSITAPANGATVPTGNVTINAGVSNNVVLTKMEFYVDGKLIGTDTSAPYSFRWNNRKAASGSHTIMVKAYDASGNIGSASISVTK